MLKKKMSAWDINCERQKRMGKQVNNNIETHGSKNLPTSASQQIRAFFFTKSRKIFTKSNPNTFSPNEVAVCQNPKEFKTS